MKTKTKAAQPLGRTTDELDSEQLKLREKLRAALSSAALLDYSPTELLGDLKSAGMGTVERLVEALLALARGARCKRVEPVLINIDAIWNSPSPPSGEQLVHRTPKMAFVAGGIEYDPADIRRFDGRELCFVPSWRRGMPYVEVFEDKSFVKNWLRLDYLSRLARGLSDIAVKGQSPIPGPKKEEPELPPPGPSQGSSGGEGLSHDLRMFEHEGWHGDMLSLAPGWAYPDLTRVSRGFMGLGDWNDIISSLAPYPGLPAGFWEHVNYEGSMFVKSHLLHDHLTEIGWNDRISSVQHWG
jgi:hypothetical protein